MQISKISRERNQKIYERLRVHVKEEVSYFDRFDPNIIETLRDFESEGDEAICVDLAALWFVYLL